MLAGTSRTFVGSERCWAVGESHAPTAALRTQSAGCSGGRATEAPNAGAAVLGTVSTLLLTVPVHAMAAATGQAA